MHAIERVASAIAPQMTSSIPPTSVLQSGMLRLAADELVCKLPHLRCRAHAGRTLLIENGARSNWGFPLRPRLDSATPVQISGQDPAPSLWRSKTPIISARMPTMGGHSGGVEKRRPSSS